MTVLITGATGFIGGRLRRPGERILVRRPCSDAAAVQGDLTDPVSLARACEGITTVFHCAGHPDASRSSDPHLHWLINFEGTRNLVDAAGRAGVKSFVFLSSVKAMADPGTECVDEDWPGEPATAYGRAKRAAEAAVLEAGAKYGMHVVCLRPVMVYGAGGGSLGALAGLLRRGWFPLPPETGNRRSVVHVNDVVSAMRLVAEHPRAAGRTYIIGYARPYSTREICEAILVAGTLPRLRFTVPTWVLRAGGKAGDALQTLLGFPFVLNSEAVAKILGSACFCPARIERELGWRAELGLEEGLRSSYSQVSPLD